MMLRFDDHLMKDGRLLSKFVADYWSTSPLVEDGKGLYEGKLMTLLEVYLHIAKQVASANIPEIMKPQLFGEIIDGVTTILQLDKEELEEAIIQNIEFNKPVPRFLCSEN